MTTWKLHDHQRPAFDTANGRSRVIINMPTGWGQSFLLCALGASDLQDGSRKVILCVPQRIIAKGFVQENDNRIAGWNHRSVVCPPAIYVEHRRPR